MSKATIIRKKALDLVRQQDWQGAIKEYVRLVEMDQSNPNVHNELADIYLKTSSKAEAYDCFVRAIDEYTRVGLFNNAVAVAKKVMRVLPARTEVLTLLGNVRMKQGLAREAESYYVSFLEKVVGSAVDAPAFKKIAREIVESTPESVPVLHKVSQCLLSFQLDEDAGEVLIKLHLLAERNGNATVQEEARASIEQLGITKRLNEARALAGKAPDPGRTVVTEQNIWNKTHSAGERIEIESTPHFTPPTGGTAQPAAPSQSPTPAESAPAAASGPSERELYLLRLARGVGGSPPKVETAKPAAAPAAPVAPPAVEMSARAVEAEAAEAEAAEAKAAEAKAAEAKAAEAKAAEAKAAATPPPAKPEVPHKPVPEPQKAATATMPRPAPKPAAPAPRTPAPAPRAPKPAGDHRQISALIDDSSGDGEGEADYRSHYDLGMAYMEMDLLSEAIREYQAASRSPQFQVKCLEMIGLCFVRQNLPQLAIKQLTKGLAMMDSESEESLGMKYNLGLAYEMIGDFASARSNFEDVYVVDVTFRDVAEKVAKLTKES